ncbi:TPA: MotA/TolQ/ExbB proton channel family protein [Candidatus Poribacteria bacterium]|nr:MotA/TolQ/ExbB proton channel family protein [Candidatus Poribacteria bacterium]
MRALIKLLYLFSTALLVPVIALLLAFFCVSFFILGAHLSETIERFRRRRDLEESLRLMENGLNPRHIKFSGLLGRFWETAKRSDFDPIEMERKILEAEIEFRRSIDRVTMISKLGPMLGLMGTLIPMGPALMGLAGGNIKQMADNLVVAFSTTVIGLASGGICYVILTIRRRWMTQDIGLMEYMAEKSRGFKEVKRDDEKEVHLGGEQR